LSILHGDGVGVGVGWVYELRFPIGLDLDFKWMDEMSSPLSSISSQFMECLERFLVFFPGLT